MEPDSPFDRWNIWQRARASFRDRQKCSRREIDYLPAYLLRCRKVNAVSCAQLQDGAGALKFSP